MRQQLAHRLRLPKQLLDAMSDYLPVRFHLVAARAGTSVFVWEVTVSPERCDAEFLHQLTFPDLVAAAALRPFLFASRDDKLLASSEYGDGYLLDARRGQELLKIREAHVLGMSPRGDVIAGNDRALLCLGMWNVSNGAQACAAHRCDAAFSKCHNLAFAPDGTLVAALVCQSGFGLDSQESWRLEVWSVGPGVRLCRRALPPGAIVRGSFRGMAFDGDVVTLCRGPALPGLYFRFRAGTGTDTHELVGDPFGQSCLDASGHLLLQIAGAEARILNVGADGARLARLAHRALLPGFRSHGLGHFSPDRRKVVASWSAAQGMYKSFVWPFADGHMPQALSEDTHRLPTFSADGELLVSVLSHRKALGIFNLSGHFQLSLQTDDMAQLREASTGSARCGPLPSTVTEWWSA